jgi:lantibiotic modifying enzyme
MDLTASTDQIVGGVEPRIQRQVEACADVLLDLAIRHDDRAGWLTWDLTGRPRPSRMRGGNPSLYDGDAGTAWACAYLARLLDRHDLAEVARAGASHALDRARTVRSSGLLAGRSGVVAAAHAIADLVGGVPGLNQLEVVPADAAAGYDVTDGLAGVLLGAVRSNAPPAEALHAVRRIASGARPEPLGCSWAGPVIAEEPSSGRPLCGLAHGNSGVAWALAEAAWAYPSIATLALTLAARALRWEAAWFDPMRSSWPDLRTQPATYSAMWCHGAAGIGAVRLRLLQLQRAGVDLPIPAATLQSEAEAALQACARALTEAVQRGHQYGPDGIGHRLTLCHGLGSAIDLLLLAHEVLGSPQHLATAQLFTDRLLDVLDDDPMLWPSGVGTGVGTGASTGLFVGLAGTALVLARAGYPEHRIAAPSLLPASDLLPVR